MLYRPGSVTLATAIPNLGLETSHTISPKRQGSYLITFDLKDWGTEKQHMKYQTMSTTHKLFDTC